MWPTEPYSVKQSSYHGDIVEQFVQSCKKYGLKPGFYYTCSFNAHMKADHPGYVISGNPEEQKQYTALIEQQLEELWSRYGEMFELWFDGGLLSVENGGPDLLPIYNKYQSNAVRFQGSALGTENNTRWVGNERGIAPYDCWSATDGNSQYDGTKEDNRIGMGNPDGSLWAPAECDTPNRKNEWFWKEGEDSKVVPAKKLMELYYKSVGRNCNLLLGMAVDTHGLIPECDMREFIKFGDMLNLRFSNKIAETSGKGNKLSLNLKPNTSIDHIVLRENLENGHAVREFKVEVICSGRVKKNFRAQCIGNKRIFRFNRLFADELRLMITKSVGTPDITELSCYFADDFSLDEKIKLGLFGNR